MYLKDGVNMKFKIIYSNRKTIAIKIESGEVIVKSPRGKSVAELQKIVEKHSEWIEKAKKRELAKRNRYSDLTDEKIKLLKKEARVYFSNLCRYYSKIMNLSYSKLRISSAKTRFGSCSSNKTISFSYLLMLYPENAREYVVVHELAHLCEMNHTRKFYDIIEKYMPDYKERRKLLKNT